MPPEKFGSLTGEANITVGGDALITGNIYASGKEISLSLMIPNRTPIWRERLLLPWKETAR